MEPVYEVEQLTKVYKRGQVRANDGITFEVRQGEILGVFGPNGAGKSTLIKQMTGMTRPTSGDVLFKGRSVFTNPLEVIKKVAYYAQEPYAITSLTVQEAVEFTGKLRGMAGQEAVIQAKRLIEKLELSEFVNKPVKQLSGGQKKLVGVAAALVGDMDVLILDEPTNELDPEKRRLIWNTVLELNRDQGVTVLLVTHNVLEAEQVVDRVAIVDYGKLLTIDSVGHLKQMVDQRLRIETTSTFGRRQVTEEALSAWGDVEVLGENRLRLYVEKNRAADVLGQIVEGSDKIACEEYKVIPPSLEDVYFSLGGREKMIHVK
ncbi:ABC transporter ATP-binding protein [Dethiobacter alkaliphilus]|uniref:ABC transporter ATP-binding protein n=1 Tax=Dethiobacter alkaliphilus TaxID=427926 RepID=UPI002227A51A|nr:ABC transporter ATP-binding protein [Dethiobacter alkaliphilus]MCW3490599.1 ABC transporter ATP-binding protein [Dethiobacter alkaliphilus]